MKPKKKSFLKKMLMLFLIVALYNLWTLRTVTVFYVSAKKGNNIVVDHLPLTDRDRIHWFREHKQEFKEKYNLYHMFDRKIYIWDIGNGFTNNQLSPHADLYCFDEMNAEKNCIEKNLLFVAETNSDGRETYYIGGMGTLSYTLSSDGAISMHRDEHFFERVYENVMQSINPLNYL